MSYKDKSKKEERKREIERNDDDGGCATTIKVKARERKASPKFIMERKL